MTKMEKGDPQTLKFSRTGKQIIAGGITLGAMQALALAAAGVDDDDPPEFVRERSLLEGVASSLTELFAPAIHEERIAGLLKHYDFANERTLAYFQRRLKEAPEDVAFTLDWVLDRAEGRERQEAVLAAVSFKTDLLWAQLDALHHAYVTPGMPPPGAFRPQGAS